uniref:G_PROTEIN_RECEP_F1_2 domain-containing protein n=1 Tax=Strongyloides venezuelensis TaxID=75913 RepID=A0A0K0FGF5_STRVS
MEYSSDTNKCQLHYNDDRKEGKSFLEKHNTIIQSTNLKKKNDVWATRDRLLIIVIIQICIVFLWILHEAIRFDHSCSSQLSSSMSNTYPFTTDSGSFNRISRSLIDETVKEPEIIALPNGTLVKVISRKRKIVVYKKPDVVDLENMPGEKNSRGILVGRKKIRVRITTPSPNDTNDVNSTTINDKKRRPIQRRYHLLTGANSKNLKNHYTSTKKESTSDGKVNTWLHGIVNPNDPQFTNKGEIRAVKVKVANKKPKIDLEQVGIDGKYIQNYNIGQDMDIKNEKENNFNVQSKSQDTGREVINDAIINNKNEGNNINESGDNHDKGSLGIPFTFLLDSEKEINKLTKSGDEFKYTSNVIPSTEYHERDNINNKKINIANENILTKQAPEKEEEEQRFEDVQPNLLTQNPSIPYFDNKDYYTSEKEDKEVNEAFKEPVTVDTSQKNSSSSNNFTTELSRFSYNTTCILRTLLAFWCLAQLSTLIFFLIGLILNYSTLRCLFIPHIISEALFTIIASIYCITITLFSTVLYILVTSKEMDFEKLLKWLALSFVILFFVLLHAWILDKKIKYFKRNEYKDEARSEVVEILHNDDPEREKVMKSKERTPNVVLSSCSSNCSNYDSNNGSLVKLYSHGDYGRRLHLLDRMSIV